MMHHRDSGRPDETLGTVLITVKANRCPAEPAEVTPPPALVTETRRIKCCCTSMCECEKDKDESGTGRVIGNRREEGKQSRMK